MPVTSRARGESGFRRGWRLRGGIAAVVLAVAGSGLTVAGTATPAAAIVLPVVSSGGGGSCALLPDQSVWCWGSDSTGQLSDSANGGSMTPIRVNTLPASINVSAGQSNNASGPNHNCAVSTINEVWCWGSNIFGELGNGTTSQDNPTPQMAQGILATQVSAGDGFSCAVTMAKTVDCWGDNNFGELGNGTTADSSTPVKVKNLANVTEVAAGYFHACALEANGTLWCWGENGNGELGNGTNTESTKPVQARISNVTFVAAGASDTCALGNAPGDLFCWGVNSDGQLGIGNFTDQNVPTQVASLSSGVQQVSMGLDFTCALANIPGPAALCWGDNNAAGTLGNGTMNKPSSDPFPVQVFGLMTPASGGPGGPAQITVGTQHACVVMTTGQVQCWGEGSDGRLGDGSSLDRDIPTAVLGLPLPAGTAVSVTAGLETSCAVTSTLQADCWGKWAGNGGSLATIHTSAVPVQQAVSQVSAGYGGCALVHNGGLSTQVRCWGSNKNGQLGNGTTTNAKAPVTVKNLTGVQYISNGVGDNCALVKNGGAWCWGYNGYGELGDGTNNSSSVPVQVQGLPANMAQISAGFEHTCALLMTGIVKCWGQNNQGQLGNGSTSDSKTPVTVTGLTDVAQVAVADELTCAMTNAGGVECWGVNLFGELGDGTSGSGTNSTTPVQVTGLTGGAVAIAASDSTVCATLFTGQVECWGDNSVGELGDGSVGTPAISDTPVAVPGFSSNGWIGVSDGFGAAACALNTSQQAFCWGDNTVGELGDGTSGAATDSGTPVAVQGL